MTTGLVTTQQIDLTSIMNLMLVMVMTFLGRA
jgi:hypothetical protein